MTKDELKALADRVDRLGIKEADIVSYPNKITDGPWEWYEEKGR